MIAVVAVLVVVNVALAAALVAVVQHAARERGALIDVIVSRTPAELRALRQASVQPTPPEVRDFLADRDRELRALGYDPSEVPAVPAGFG